MLKEREDGFPRAHGSASICFDICSYFDRVWGEGDMVVCSIKRYFMHGKSQKLL